MLKRSLTTSWFADAHAAVWCKNIQQPPEGAHLSARTLAPGYEAARRRMICNYTAFAAGFAPTVTAEYLQLEDRPRLLIAVPVGFGDALAALVPTRGACFAVPLVPNSPLLEQAVAVGKFLPCDALPQEMSITRDHHADIIFAMPCTFPITTASATIIQPSETRVRTQWVGVDALTSRTYVHTVLALERARSFTEPIPWYEARIGAMQAPVPVSATRAASEYTDSKGTPAARVEWDGFLLDEKRRGEEIALAFTAKNSDGLLDCFVGSIATAHSRQNDLIAPPQGLPRIDAATMAIHPWPADPMPRSSRGNRSIASGPGESSPRHSPPPSSTTRSASRTATRRSPDTRSYASARARS